MKEFFTRQKANEGKELPLYLPSGEKSEHTIRVLGVDSDTFKKNDAKAKREAMELSAIEDDKERQEALAKVQSELIASLVVDWSFEQECTLENVVNFFKEAPQIQEAVNKFAANRRAFFS